MKHGIGACEMTHSFGPFETWRIYESIGDTERVKARFGCSKVCRARCMLTIWIMLSEMSLADDAGTGKLRGCRNEGKRQFELKWEKGS